MLPDYYCLFGYSLVAVDINRLIYYGLEEVIGTVSPQYYIIISNN